MHDLIAMWPTMHNLVKAAEAIIEAAGTDFDGLATIELLTKLRDL